MKFERELIEQWLALRNPRESVLIFMAGLSVIYLLWNLIFELPLHHQIAALKKRNEQAQSDLDTQKQKLITIETIIASSSFIHELAAQKKLASQSNDLGAQLKKMELNFIPVEWLPKITNDIIEKQEEVLLLSLKTFPEEAWSTSKTPAVTNAFSMPKVFKHKMQIELRGTYFNVIDYLSHLEKLPWHLYWDSLDYKVLTYPEADVVAQFYVLSN